MSKKTSFPTGIRVIDAALFFFNIPSIVLFLYGNFNAALMLIIRAGASTIDKIRSIIQPIESILLRLLRFFLYWGPFKVAFDAIWNPFPGVVSPPELYWGQGIDEFGNRPLTGNVEILAASAGAILSLVGIIGQPKKIHNNKNNFQIFQPYFNYFVNFSIIGRKEGTSLANNNLPEDYQYFGIDDGVSNLLCLLRSNPFFASTLTPIRDVNTKKIIAFGIYPFDDSTYFGKTMAVMHPKYKRVEATFAPDLSSILSIVVYQPKDITSEPIIHVDDATIPINDKANLLTNLIMYYSEVVHATIHLFHYLLTTCMSRATLGSSPLNDWAYAFNENVSIKYLEIVTALFLKYFGALNQSTQIFFNAWMAGPHSSVVQLASDLCKEWSSYDSAHSFLLKFLFPKLSVKELDDADICVTWREHVALVEGYSQELSDAFGEVHAGNYSQINAGFQLLTSQTGYSGVGGVKTIRQFVELMSVTGLLHNGTMSFTRLITTAPVLALLCPEEEYFTIRDALICAIGILTITGSKEGHTVFSWTIPYTEVPNNVIKVFQKYSFLSSKIKAEYYASIKDRPDFKYLGFILTDHAPDEIDGKQYSLTTYM